MLNCHSNTLPRTNLVFVLFCFFWDLFNYLDRNRYKNRSQCNPSNPSFTLGLCEIIYVVL